MNAKSPAFQFYPADYLSDMKVRMLSWEQRGLYVDLLCYCWREGWIPSEIEAIICLTNYPNKEGVELCLNLFDKHPDDEYKLIHLRLEKEREKQRNWSKSQSKKGKLSGKSRSNKVLYVEPVLNQCSTGVQPIINRNGSTQTNSSSSSSSSTLVIQTPNPLRGRIGKWFNRRDPERWSEKETKALEKINPTEEELLLMEGYYTAIIPDEKNYRRRDLQTLLNNWNGELDRARSFKPARRESVI